MMNLIYIAIGLGAGMFSGLLGLGGGFIIVPILLYGLGFTQHQAQGTSLAIMIPPITLLAAWRYYNSGNVKVNIALFIAAGFAIGGLLGADLVQRIPDVILKRVFGITLFLISIRMIFFK